MPIPKYDEMMLPLLQLRIPGNTFHTARVIGRHRWFLGASTEWPGVEPVDVEIGNVDALAAKYPCRRSSHLPSARQGIGRRARTPPP